MEAMKSLVSLVVLLGACGGDPCADLAEVCGRCPDDETGRVARKSCDGTVASEDEAACEDRLEQRTYEAYGCR